MFGLPSFAPFASENQSSLQTTRCRHAGPSRPARYSPFSPPARVSPTNERRVMELDFDLARAALVLRQMVVFG